MLEWKRRSRWSLVRAQPDLTLVELSARLHREASITLSRGRVWYLVRKLGLVVEKKSLYATERHSESHGLKPVREEFAAKIGAIAPRK